MQSVTSNMTEHKIGSAIMLNIQQIYEYIYIYSEVLCCLQWQYDKYRMSLNYVLTDNRVYK